MLLRALIACFTALWLGSAMAQTGNPLRAAFLAGIKAVAERRYRDAEASYKDVIGLARAAKTNTSVLAEYLYQAGQATGLACNFNQAEKLLLEALLLAEQAEKVRQGRSEFSSVTWKLFEVAHFYSDRGFNAESHPYWDKFIPRYDELNKTSAQDPIAYSMMLRDYGNALAAVGNQVLAEEKLRESERLAKDNAELFTRIAWYKYGKNCP
jgi:tetratricopeptide (TPR) repeat protein